MAAIRTTVQLEIDNRPSGIADPLTRRLECSQVSVSDALPVPPAPGTLNAFLPQTVVVPKVWLLTSDQQVNIYATGSNGPELAFTLNPGGFLVLIDGSLGQLLLENANNPTTAPIANVVQLVAGNAL